MNSSQEWPIRGSACCTMLRECAVLALVVWQQDASLSLSRSFSLSRARSLSLSFCFNHTHSLSLGQSADSGGSEARQRGPAAGGTRRAPHSGQPRGPGPISSGRVCMIDTRAQRILMHTCIILVILKQHLVRIGRIDGPTQTARACCRRRTPRATLWLAARPRSDSITASIYDKYSVGSSIRRIRTRC